MTSDESAPVPTIRPREISFSPDPFEPAWWLRGPHVQTIGGRWLRPARDGVYDRRSITTPDGDFLDLDIARLEEDGAGDVVGEGEGIVLLLHGLEGCSTSRYMLETTRNLAARGLQAIALNFRSCGGEPNRNRRFYHSGETNDLDFVVDWIRERCPGLPLGAIGFSLGGNVLLKYLGERGAEASRRSGWRTTGAARSDGGGHDGIRAAVAVSVPYDLAASVRKLESGLTGAIYARFFLRSLRRSVRAKIARYAHDYDMEALAAARTMRDFDDAITAPVHGFADAADYYRAASSGNYLSTIRVPTLLLQAEDDPFVPRGHLPRRDVAGNPWLHPVFMPRGGHLGFVEGDLGRPRFWAERQAARFMAAALSS